MTSKEYLLEGRLEKSKNQKIYITFANDDEDIEVKFNVTFDMIPAGQGYDHEDETYNIDPESLDFHNIESFNFDGQEYSKNEDLSDLYGNVFIDDEYIKQSDFLKTNVRHNFMKPGLSSAKLDEVFRHFLIVQMLK